MPAQFTATRGAPSFSTTVLIEASVLAEVEEAVEIAMAAPRPDMKTLETDVYVRY